MNIARPATGFLIKEPASFAVYIDGFSAKWPRLPEHWIALKERLKMTAHTDGHPLGHPLHRVFESAGDANLELPTIRVAYFVFADTLTFIAIAVLESV